MLQAREMFIYRALAAIQGLHEVVKEKDARLAELEGRVAELERQMQERDARLLRLEQALLDLGGDPDAHCRLHVRAGVVELHLLAFRRAACRTRPLDFVEAALGATVQAMRVMAAIGSAS